MSDNPSIDELDIDAIIAHANAHNRRACTHGETIHQNPQKLREAFAAFHSSQPDFQPGDLLTWKPGWRNRQLPDYDQPCVLMRVLEVCLESEMLTDRSVPVAIDTANIEVAAFDDDGDICLFLADSRRFVRWSETS